MRRLTDAGLVVESGRQVGGRGRAGTYCRLRADQAGPRCLGGTRRRRRGHVRPEERAAGHAEQPVASPVRGVDLAPIVRAVVGNVGAQNSGAIRSCVVSMAGPVDRQTGRLAASAYAPFLVGEFAPKDVLRDLALVVEVDNDVNWAALAERVHGNATDLDDFVLCYLGEGVGGAVVIDGAVVRGGRGRAGELAHARTTGPGGRSMTLFASLAAADLLRPGSEAIDVGRVRAILEGSSAADRRRAAEIAEAVAGAIGSVVALLDPHGVLVGGPWGGAPDFSIFLPTGSVRRPTPNWSCGRPRSPKRRTAKGSGFAPSPRPARPWPTLESTWVVVSEFGDARAPTGPQSPGRSRRWRQRRRASRWSLPPWCRSSSRAAGRLREACR